MCLIILEGGVSAGMSHCGSVALGWFLLSVPPTHACDANLEQAERHLGALLECGGLRSLLNMWAGYNGKENLS